MGINDLLPGAQPDHTPKDDLTDDQRMVLEKIAKKVVEWRMAVPAIMALETAKPLSFIGSQVLVFFEPIVQSIFSMKYYDTFRELMEDRQNVERLLQLIEKFDAELVVREREYKKKLKTWLRKQTWGKRLWLWLTGKYPNLDQLNEELSKYGQMTVDE